MEAELFRVERLADLQTPGRTYQPESHPAAELS
jgi:hypothetical protein